MNADSAGFRVAIEGAAVAGCTSVRNLLEQHLAGQGIPVVQDAERMEDRGMLARESLFARMAANRAWVESASPLLTRGYWALEDRTYLAEVAAAALAGVETVWLEAAMAFALPPTLGIYLAVDPATAALRAVRTRGHLSDSDCGPEADRYTAFIRRQTKMAARLAELAERFGFHTIDANRPLETVWADVKALLHR